MKLNRRQTRRLLKPIWTKQACTMWVKHIPGKNRNPRKSAVLATLSFFKTQSQDYRSSFLARLGKYLKDLDSNESSSLSSL